MIQDQSHTHSEQPVYLFNPAHRPFIDGQTDVPPTDTTRKRVLWQFVYSLCGIAIPLIIIIDLVVALAGYRLDILVIIQAIVSVIGCGLIAWRRYRREQCLHRDGKLLYGTILRIEQPTDVGYKQVNVRVIYRFTNTHGQRIIHHIDLVDLQPYADQRLIPPKVGATIAIVYAPQGVHRVL